MVLQISALAERPGSKQSVVRRSDLAVVRVLFSRLGGSFAIGLDIPWALLVKPSSARAAVTRRRSDITRFKGRIPLFMPSSQRVGWSEHRSSTVESEHAGRAPGGWHPVPPVRDPVRSPPEGRVNLVFTRKPDIHSFLDPAPAHPRHFPCPMNPESHARDPLRLGCSLQRQGAGNRLFVSGMRARRRRLSTIDD